MMPGLARIPRLRGKPQTPYTLRDGHLCGGVRSQPKKPGLPDGWGFLVG